MKNCMPEAYKELVENCEILEGHYKDMMVLMCYILYTLFGIKYVSSLLQIRILLYATGY